MSELSLRAIHFSPLPCSDLGQGVAMIVTAFAPPRFFAQTLSSLPFLLVRLALARATRTNRKGRR